MARCPAHDDQHASLSVTTGRDGRVLMKCHGGCANESIVAAMGLTQADQFPPRESRNGNGRMNGHAKHNGNGHAKPEKKHAVYATFQLAIKRGEQMTEGAFAQDWIYTNLVGKEVFRVARFNLPDRDKKCLPFTPVPNGYYIGDPAGPLPLYRLAHLGVDEPIFITEGEKAADAIVGLGLIATTSSHGSQAAKKTDWSPLAGRTAFILPDNDKPGDDYARDVEKELSKNNPPTIASVVTLPNLPEKGDAVEWVQAGGTADKLMELCEAVPQREESESDLPEIHTGRQLPEITADVVRALSAANRPTPNIYTRGGSPVRLRATDNGKTVIAPMSEAAMRGRIARVARFFRPGRNDSIIPISPPMDVVQDVFTLDLYEHGGFPILEAVTGIPVLRPDDFSIVSNPGYDTATRLFYAPSPGLKIPAVSDKPSASNVQRAASLIDEAIGEFPYETGSDSANAVGTLITLAVRQAINGKSPLALFDAPQAGTGKSLLAETIGVIGTGGSPAMMGAPHDENEWRKQITSTLIEGPTVIVIDNVDAPITSGSLSRALTSEVWSDRELGFSRQANLTNLATWISTGNNIEVGGDMPRRCYRVRLDAKTARPWRGRTFRHPNLLEWVRENRGELIWAMLTLCRAWHIAGRPLPAGIPVIGSFEAWSKTVGGILHFAGISGFLANLDEMYEQADDGANEWDTFLRAWHSRFSSQEIPTSKIVDDLQLPNAADLRDALPEGLGAFVVYQPGSYTQAATFTIKDAGRFKIRLGKQLRQRVGRRYGDDEIHLCRREDSHAKTSVWWVECAGSAGSDAGSEKTTPRNVTPESIESEIDLRVVRGVFPNLNACASARAPAQGVRVGDSPQPTAPPANDPDDYERMEREALQSEGA
jgi:hypothetical protein